MLFIALSFLILIKMAAKRLRICITSQPKGPNFIRCPMWTSHPFCSRQVKSLKRLAKAGGYVLCAKLVCVSNSKKQQITSGDINFFSTGHTTDGLTNTGFESTNSLTNTIIPTTPTLPMYVPSDVPKSGVDPVTAFFFWWHCKLMYLFILLFIFLQLIDGILLLSRCLAASLCLCLWCTFTCTWTGWTCSVDIKRERMNNNNNNIDALSASVEMAITQPTPAKRVKVYPHDRGNAHSETPSSVSVLDNYHSGHSHSNDVLLHALISPSTVLIYAKQENEEVFHPLHLVPPSLVGLAVAVSIEAVSWLRRCWTSSSRFLANLTDVASSFFSSRLRQQIQNKYKLEAKNIRHIFKRCRKG